MKTITMFLLAALATTGPAWALIEEPEPATPDSIEDYAVTPQDDAENAYRDWAKGIWETLDRQTGLINLAGTGATLNVPDTFYFLGREDATTVLEDVWDNPPGNHVLGMLFPADMTPFDDESWAVTVEFESDGYVSDEDAEDIDYNDMLKQMQKDVKAASKERVEQGYEAIALIGWAATPYYDKPSHKLHWAKEIQFGDSPEHTLNYNIRVLGRKGVLVLNFVADMEQKALIERNLDTVLAMADFDNGSRYADFDPAVDKVAAYGLGALVAGKVLAKTGLLAGALIFLKKFGVFLIVGVGALFRKVMGRGRQEG